MTSEVEITEGREPGGVHPSKHSNIAAPSSVGRRSRPFLHVHVSPTPPDHRAGDGRTE
jgi:hypothetical protein